MTLDPALLAEVRDLDRQATPKPWHDRHVKTPRGYSTSAVSPDTAEQDELSPADLALFGRIVALNLSGNDARLIARYRTLAPLLADEVERLQAGLGATQRAKAENDERFMIERDEARRELDDERRFIGVYRAAATEALGIDPRSCADDVKEAIGEVRAERDRLEAAHSTALARLGARAKEVGDLKRDLESTRPRWHPAPPPAGVWVLRERPGRNPIPVLTFDAGEVVEFWTDDSACVWGDARWCPIPTPGEP